jgi:small GTP-binding protein
MEEPEAIKICLLDDSGVGKSSLALRFVINEWRPYSDSTIGASFSSKTMEIPQENEDETQIRQVSFKIWDTAGQEKYHSLAGMYYRGAAAAIIVYGTCNSASFRALKLWVDEVRLNGPNDIVLAVCGNKSDLAQHRQVPLHDAETYAEEVGAFYMETSARNDNNVRELFCEIGKRVFSLRARDSTASVSRVDSSIVNLGYVEPSSKCC